MKSQKNELAVLEKNQANCYLALPGDFEITRDDDEIFHGQRSDMLQKRADAACSRQPSKRSPATETSDAKPSHTN